MAEHNQQGRRPHYHRGRRGSDRRGPDRRSGGPPPQEQGGRDQQDVEQIMREIRARISQRHGIELTTPQIQELAARRLEAILDPRTINPSLLEQLRRSAGTPAEPKPAETAPAFEFEDRTIYESHNGLLRFIRRMLNPILKLFFNPNPIAHALHTQAKLNASFAAREAERERRQAEWNALHYDILQRLVTETARVSIEMQALSSRVEALNARVDFADRRVRMMEAAPPARAQQPRPAEARPAVAAAPPAPQAAGEETAPEPRPEGAAAGEGLRRRRRRRRGRRSGITPGEPIAAAADAQLADADVVEGDTGEGGDLDEPIEEESAAAPEAFDTAEVEAVAEERSQPPMTAAASPPPFPTDEEGAATTPPSPPRDEPAPPPVETPTEPEDR